MRASLRANSHNLLRQALHWAVNNGYGEVMVKLLNSGIDVTAKTYRDKSASDIALSKGYQKVFIELIF